MEAGTLTSMICRYEAAIDTFATYFFPKTSPPVPVRIDKPSPGSNCPQQQQLLSVAGCRTVRHPGRGCR
ncbi:MAG: hypothetical protein ACRDJV_12125 [Actinomycetota bacterium]